ncbi:heterotrimeric G protein alpha subunit [Mycena floridula]|nr:heterotrimeric G protein alpha subunit [Mycena floridula]
MGTSPVDPTDPFLVFLQPPPDETPSQKTARQKRELDAQRVSDQIDEDIRNHRARLKKEKHIIKVLLLGQAESGKSTTLKNFRMRYAPEDWEQERSGWKQVIQLNIVRSVIKILTVVEAELNGEPLEDSDEEDSDHMPTESTKFTDRHQLLMIRLAPLRGVETDLKRRLGAPSEANYAAPVPLPMSATPFDTPQTDPTLKRGPVEFSVRTWNEVVHPDAVRAHQGVDSPELDSSTITIASCRNDMKALWVDKTVQLALARRKIRLPDSAGFFLNELERIATRDYCVSDDDIVRARLRTVGIQEYRIRIKSGSWDTPKTDGAWEWRIYDVGGCRTSRAAWLPYFENTQAIIFLCPVSCFDEHLEEDPRINRLEDSILLWKSICSSTLLARTQLILFMNKCDLLKRKLKRGVLVKKHLISYGDRPNEVMPVVKYLREKFKETMKVHSPLPRSFYIYPTTVTDTKATAKTLESVRDGVLRENLGTSQLI